ncbi:hypothetical protein [Actinomadura livida]|uniref:Uncharacterized protein n=1 Tax=Actinomadura livida TaxID=79909 RepID=A0A7W7I771_9ACTN|nr:MULTISPECIES: hypothetical protein [Actinomadura]MBB4771806.1 hypothetical protein [Actinomadura catellatispora]GGU02600.1 hypothetical protein GCM10010208_28280 [Actinomadura livida]
MIEISVEVDGEQYRLTVGGAGGLPAPLESLPDAMVPLLLAALVELGPRPTRNPQAVRMAKAGVPTVWVRAGERRWRIAVGEPGGSPTCVLDIVDAADEGLWTLHASPVVPDDETGDLVPGEGTVLRPITSTDVWTWISHHIATCT